MDSKIAINSEKWLLENLVCPRDYSNLQLKNDFLTCAFGHLYPYIDGIPIMLLKEAKPTHGACCKSVEQPSVNHEYNPYCGTEVIPGAIDPYVQSEVAGTCGIMYRKLINKLNRYPIPELCLPSSKGQYFLDIGCNWGRWCISAANKGYTCVGIDPSLDGIKAAYRVARQLGVSNIYIVADSRCLPFRSNFFDVIFSYSVFQHFDKHDVCLSLAEIKRTLKTSGLSLIQMPNIFGLRNLYNQAKRGFRNPVSFEVRYWFLSELRRTFRDLIGPTSSFVDGYFSLNAQVSDIDLFPLKYGLLINSSEILRRISVKVKWFKYFSDSIYVKSIKMA